MTSPGLDPPSDVGGENLDVGGSVAAASSTQPSSSVDLAPLRAYLLQLLPPVLGASPGALDRFLVPGGRWEQTAARFICDANVNAVYVSQLRKVSRDEGEGIGASDEPREQYELSSSVASYSAEHRATLALIKRSPTLDILQPLAGQLHLLNLFGPSAAAAPASSAASSAATTAPPDGQPGQLQHQQQQQQETPYESLHQIVHWGVGPWFEAFVESRQQTATGAESKDSKGEDGKMGIPMTKKKFAELELSLLHLQQNVEIPDTTLIVHPAIAAAVERARAAGERVSPSAVEPQTLVADPAFLTSLQQTVSTWIKAIQSTTRLSRDPTSGTASQEINFWISMERALDGIENQLRSDGVALTLDVLKEARRFHATVSFVSDTGLKEAMSVVHNYNQLMKDFPLNDLLAATDLPKIASSIGAIFRHISTKLRLSPYPIRRALPLVTAISRDFNDALLRVLGTGKLMFMSWDAFERIMGELGEVFGAWDDNMKEFTGIARDLTRKRAEKFIQIKIAPAHVKLQERLAYLRRFRKQHEQLKVMTGPTKGLMKAAGAGTARALTNGEAAAATYRIPAIDMEDEVRLAYEAVRGVDVLDVSVGGTELWVTAEAAYGERVARVENHIIARLRDRLGTARNANEMFRVFRKFNALLVRQKIRGAIQEYQTQLIESVKDDIKELHQKFIENYRHSDAFHMAQLRDLPPVAGAVIWARQIERQLATYMQRVEDVLGRGWKLYAEGQKLQSESASFKRKLDTRPLYEAWLADIQRRDMKITGRLLNVVRVRATGAYTLVVNFDPQVITLFKEVRNLIWLNFHVPHNVSSMAKEARKVYPHAVSLMETVRTYNQTVELVASHPDITLLLADYRNEVQLMISKGMPLRWEMFVNLYDRETRHLAFVREFASAVTLLQEKSNAAIDTAQIVDRLVTELTTCPYSSTAFSTILAQFQAIVDRLNLEGYANLDGWVLDLDARVEKVLLKRLAIIIREWCAKFARGVDDDDRLEAARRRVGFTGEQREDGIVEVIPFRHEVRIQNQVIYLDPPIEHARASWMQQLQAWLSVICGLKRIQSSRYEIGLHLQQASEHASTYLSLLAQFDDSTLEEPFRLIEAKVHEVSAYVGRWLQFQSLWDLEPESVYLRLGDSLGLWAQLLTEIKQTRLTFDNADSERSFGVCVIDYATVQGKVNAKYDAWQRDILARYGNKLGSAMRETHAAVLKARHDLERQSIEGGSTAQAVGFITFVQDLNRLVVRWTSAMTDFGVGQQTLERQRYQFPADWLYIDQVQGEWSAFNEILKRKNDSIQQQLSGLQMKIVAEDRLLDGRIDEVLADWDRDKPIQGSVKAEHAIATLNIYEGRLNKLREGFELVCRAKEALDLESTKDNKLGPIVEELADLKAVWTALSGVWAQIAEIREMSWSSVQPRKLRQQLDGLLASTKEMPSRMRQYSAFEHVQETVRGLLKTNVLVGELKSDALRERHWRRLFKILRSAQGFSGLTLGQVYDLDLRRNETLIRNVLAQAAGEMALEEYLKQVRETWTSYALELVQYQTKCRLIKGWDELFARCGEHIAALAAMRLSPYYKEFEEEASSWEAKLNRLHVLFDVWIDVQRQWVYLEGIFAGSADIKHLLPVESARFANINTEFLAVMKRVYKSPFVLDVLAIPGVQKSLERLADLLAKIQKALGEYLERERASFPRFYFVGDEDLLEIIGNSKDVVRVMKHLKKMFAGVSALLLDDDGGQIDGVASREGEEIRFNRPIVLAETPRINDWLARIESETRLTLAVLLSQAVGELEALLAAGLTDPAVFLAWVDKFPCQLVVLAVQCAWTSLVDGALGREASLEPALTTVGRCLDLLADAVLEDLTPTVRRKAEHLITELVHERDVVRSLIAAGVASRTSFDWICHMRFDFDSAKADPLDRLQVCMAGASFVYGFEYLGIPDRLVQTPLTDRCYLTLTQALSNQLGGSPFGPAGTGKTESVKALGAQLGRFVLVFCCDESFDFQAMGRIFVGLCQVGAWGCFDEFNRLEERILSAVSQQVQTIQQGLSAVVNNPEAEIELVGKQLKVNANTGLFITMNPGYAGRSNLPDNLKKLFRSMAMTKPDLELIAQVMLFSQGFRAAELLASKVVPFFGLCAEQLSTQPHYDFGLRALKAVLASAGHLKRDRLLKGAASANAVGSVAETLDAIAEQQILIQSIVETIVPKLVAEDVPLLMSLLSDVFPNVAYVPVDLTALRAEIAKVCADRRLVVSEAWVSKVLQLYQIQQIQHGLMMVGPSGTGKTEAWQVILAALSRLDGVEGVSYVIDPKAMHKDALYGTLDPTTREWNDGLFTHILRRIVDDVRGESHKRHWIIFDGDVDPEWVENLNSVLDDNKLLTLPNGERLSLPPNVRIMFEVEHLRYATLATVSRCGMIWFSGDVVSPDMLYRHYLDGLRATPLDAEEDDAFGGGGASSVGSNLTTQRSIADLLEPFFAPDGLANAALEFAGSIEHIMDFTPVRALNTLFSLLNKTARNVLDYDAQHADFPLGPDRTERYVTKRMLVCLVWAFAGDARLELRAALGDHLRAKTAVDLPAGGTVVDYDVAVASGDWAPWHAKVPTIEIDTHAVTASDVVIPTVDTVRHEDVLYSWLAEHKPLMLCGPPGSGKTMTLFSALRKLPQLEVVGLNFSSATTPELILKTFEQYCEYRKTPSGTTLAPVAIGRWLVLFCDEINLPALDRYGTQRVISFIRQLVERGGFWRTSDMAWVSLERIQFVGACNPPTDPGRIPLSHRFLRHAPLVMVDYPGEVSLGQIYGTFNRALLKVVPNLRAFAEPLTAAMVAVYRACQQHFTADTQAHYIYSPRELTRWTRGIYEALRPLETLSVEGLVRVWAHEALRLFSDRLVAEAEREWTDALVDATAREHFPTVDHGEALARPILFSQWTTKHYLPVEREALREYTKARLRNFHEEELDVQLVLFNDVLDHVLRIDRVFRQTQGHMLLIGVSGSGKTTLSRFVAWMNGLSIFQIKVSNRYTAADFDDDLRNVLRRAGCKGEKICFIMDESNVLDAGFLERMNTLLANAEVPGLFEGDEHAALMTACKEGSQRDGLMLDSPEELYRWFTSQVARNLHVVFTMNPPEHGLATRAATSPALFNRCVLDWFGDWSDQAFFQVACEFTAALDLDTPGYEPPPAFPIAYRQLAVPPSHRLAVMNAFVFVHQSLYRVNARLTRQNGRYNHVTPRHYIDFINHFVRLFGEKRDELEEQQRHLNVGLDKLLETVSQVEELRHSLAAKRVQLEAKDAEANAKLRQMVHDQQEAEQKKAASFEIQASLATQEAQIEERSTIVHNELAEAEPALAEAESAVRNIRKQHLTEVRSMANPPEAVKMAMESVCTVLGHKLDGWKTVQSILRRDDFIPSITQFKTAELTKPLRERMEREYLSRPTYTFETVDRASKACGPLVKWVIAQVRFASILEHTEPLRAEVGSLRHELAQTKHQAASIMELIEGLERSIDRYKDDYARLISETQAIKGEMERVALRVDRSVTLLGSLSAEQERWQAGSKAFEAEMGTIIGDVLLSAAFLAYGGFFDQAFREVLWHEWADHLDAAGIRAKPELAFPEFLSTADDRLGWQAKALPADALSFENAIMLKRFNRYPLVIDPTGQATAFLLNEYRDRRMTVTSFLDEAFLKHLESALRFGTPILIQDVEHLDPILNAVLNREIRRTGGRVLIRLGNQDIDFSPAFTMFLTTRNPAVEFAPDICSRVTFVNFTMTRASLQSQALDKVLQVERPETETKRRDLVRLQGEFALRLRQLERSLLQALNDSEGNILDNDSVIDTLETLKREAGEVATKAAQTDAVMTEVDAVTADYLPLARACSQVFFVLDQLGQVNRFYAFSLAGFLDIFEGVLLRNGNLAGLTDPTARLIVLRRDLFIAVYRRTASALLVGDRLVLALLLAQLALRGTHDDLADELDLMLDTASTTATLKTAKTPQHPLMDSESADQLRLFAQTSTFGAVETHMAAHANDWAAIFHAAEPEAHLPADLWESEDALARACHSLLLLRAIRPDRLEAAASAFVADVFSVPLEAEEDLQTVMSESQATTPIALASIPGHDAAFRVEALFAGSSDLLPVAMGSAEGLRLAEQAIAEAARTGKTVLLKNVHLVPGWLSSNLEKRLQTLRPHPRFRIFLTMETSDKIPTSILRTSRVLMNEPPRGLKATLLLGLRSLTPKQISSGPAEKQRLYLLACFLHAVIQERLTYAPIGWTKAYEINDAELFAAFRAIDLSLEPFAGRTNVDPATLPWTALRSLITTPIYGGKIGESDSDASILKSFVDSIFQPAAFDGAPLVPTSSLGPGLSSPEGTQVSQYLAWASSLPDRNPTSWLNLAESSAKAMASANGRKLLRNLRKMVSLDDTELVPSDAASSTRPAWMTSLLRFVEQASELLPKTVSKPTGDTADPLFRFFLREHETAARLLRTVRADLAALRGVVEGSNKQTNDLRTLISALFKGIVPGSWSAFKLPSAHTSPLALVSSLALRLAQLERVAQSSTGAEATTAIQLGLLFSPRGWLSATQQFAARREGQSLERFRLELGVAPEEGKVDTGRLAFTVTGVHLSNATLTAAGLALAESTTALPPLALRWVPLPLSGSATSQQTTDSSRRTMTLAVYLDEDRAEVLFECTLPIADDETEHVEGFVKRAVAMMA